MERIGIAASKIARGNLFLYNFTVVMISFLFSLLIFFIGGLAVSIALILIACLLQGVMPANFGKEWWIYVRLVCMISLAIMAGLFSLVAIARNIKLSK